MSSIPLTLTGAPAAQRGMTGEVRLDQRTDRHESTAKFHIFNVVATSPNATNGGIQLVMRCVQRRAGHRRTRLAAPPRHLESRCAGLMPLMSQLQ